MDFAIGEKGEPMRLIDADELIDFITHSWHWQDVDDISSTIVLKQLITDIKNMPPIDAEPCDLCANQADCEDMHIYCPAEPKIVKDVAMPKGFTEWIGNMAKHIHGGTLDADKIKVDTVREVDE